MAVIDTDLHRYEAQVKELLLSHLSHLKNVDEVAKVAKDLKI